MLGVVGQEDMPFPHRKCKHIAHIIYRSCNSLQKVSQLLFMEEKQARVYLQFQDLAVYVCVWCSPESPQVPLILSVFGLHGDCEAEAFVQFSGIMSLDSG